MLATAEGKKLEESLFSVLEPHPDLWQHVYRITIIIVLKLQKSYSSGRQDFAEQSGPKGGFIKKLIRDDTICRRKWDVLLHIWKDKREIHMISTI
jgi:hypothetical protein